ncbi:MAG: nucleotide pyrophosphohydrolase [Planctomycetota bacterium]|nr:MAG: nucleotide pyrophosphohydrolase [Planctomycetota bacterium]REJ92082.1 MAG: nucleotide pyrophosphohydrolase [Planctomycetota bacterium]REK28618.1 MAG: nucleotide pyrophosphohydrolase [Planctomycetota bacterium]REK39232.1 MAG: nucleotide pyrophosphohydrolase [Planctomycetota bacterium]
MELQTFQREAAKTDQAAGESEKSILIPLLGLAGEVGTLLSEYKKFLRDGHAHLRFKEQVAEDLGDLLWYVANAATKFGFDLEEIARANIEKTRSRWPTSDKAGQYKLFDDRFPLNEQFPRKFRVSFSEAPEGDAVRVVIAKDGEIVGDPLTDNAREDDGYRFHDVFHLSYVAVLGWSPIIRKLFGVKRKSDSETDEVEDGARARIIEEMISQLVYTYAREHNYLEGVPGVDYHLLKTIQALVADREVKIRSLADWEKAILDGYEVWRAVRSNGGGTVEVDLLERRIALAT